MPLYFISTKYFQGSRHGAAVEAVGAVIESVINARNHQIRHVIPEPVLQGQLAAVRRGAVAGKDRNIFSVAFLVPHTEVGLQGQGRRT